MTGWYFGARQDRPCVLRGAGRRLGLQHRLLSPRPRAAFNPQAWADTITDMTQHASRAGDGPAIIPADVRHAERVFATITLAFAADPASRWLLPEAERYLRLFPIFARALGGAALPNRTTFMSRDCTGVALWLAPGVAPDEQALEAFIEDGVTPDKQAVMGGVMEAMIRHHPHEPHWYLPFIAVEPRHQGNGLGAALLRAQLAICDDAQLPACLDSTNPRNRPLYERHGFEAVAEIKLGDCPPIVPMLRRPRPVKPA
jgi:ribosomal protein S18 acetylase RimI-like enzyme